KRNETVWLGLGEIVAKEQLIPADAIATLGKTLESFKQMAEAERAEDFFVFATDSIRRASNQDEVLAGIRRKSGIRIQIIDGHREAALALKGVLFNASPLAPFLLVEVGGGSVQVARYDGTAITHEESLPLGTGRLIAELELSHPYSSGTLGALQE